MKKGGELQAAAMKEVVSRRKLRSDTVDTLGLVVQPSADFINALSRNEQTRFFQDSLEVMQENSDWFGKIETAVIHYDENTPHMQCLASTINEQTLTSDAKRIVGNKSKMSDRQTLLADGMKARGWDIERGIKRVDNPEYKNFKNEMEQQGIKVNRHNDRKLMEEFKTIQAEKRRQLSREKELKERAAVLQQREQSVMEREIALQKRENELKLHK